MSISSATTASPRKGVIYMILAMVVFSILNAIIKDANDTFHPVQLVFFRCFFAIVPCGVVLLSRKQLTIPERSTWLSHGLRAVLLAVGLTALFDGVPYLPLSNAMALFFSSSIFVVLLSYPILKEKIQGYQWGGVFVGFAGILLITEPDTNAMNIGAALVVTGAFFESCYNLIGRKIARYHDSLSLTFWGSLLPAALISIPLIFVWCQPDMAGWISLIALGVGGGIGQLLITSAFTHAPGGTVAPFIYTAIIWSTILDVILYQNFPGFMFWTGCALVVGAGLYNVYRERIPQKKAITS